MGCVVFVSQMAHDMLEGFFRGHVLNAVGEGVDIRPPKQIEDSIQRAIRAMLVVSSHSCVESVSFFLCCCSARILTMARHIVDVEVEDVCTRVMLKEFSDRFLLPDDVL